MDFIRIEPGVRGLSGLFRARRRRNLSRETNGNYADGIGNKRNAYTHAIRRDGRYAKLDRSLINEIDLALHRYYTFLTVVIGAAR